MAIVTLGAIALWRFDAAREIVREEASWSGCLGRPLSACRFPDGYPASPSPCPAWLGCAGAGPGERILVTFSERNRGEFLPSALHALLVLDRNGRLRKVTVRRTSNWAI